MLSGDEKFWSRLRENDRNKTAVWFKATPPTAHQERIPNSLAEWLARRTPPIGLSRHQETREVVFRIAAVLGHPSENKRA